MQFVFRSISAIVLTFPLYKTFDPILHWVLKTLIFMLSSTISIHVNDVKHLIDPVGYIHVIPILYLIE